MVASAVISGALALAAAPPAGASPGTCSAVGPNADGYDLVASDGGIFTFGNSPFCGSTGSMHLNKPVVGMARTPDNGGYWLVASDGGMFTFGDAGFYGSEGADHLNAPIVGMAAAPDGKGYWLVASDGGIFTFGDAVFHGSEGADHLNAPIVGMAAAPDGDGYWLVASDGGIFTFGDAVFHGSSVTGAPVAPTVAMVASPDGKGYWIVDNDGTVNNFGDTTFYGDVPLLGIATLNAPVLGMEIANGGTGYRLVASDGGVFSFGNAPFLGSEGGHHLNQPIVGTSGPVFPASTPTTCPQSLNPDILVQTVTSSGSQVSVQGTRVEFVCGGLNDGHYIDFGPESLTLAGTAPVTVLVSTSGGLQNQMITAAQFPVTFSGGLISPFFQILGTPSAPTGLVNLFQP